jgi:hypothetical protein
MDYCYCFSGVLLFIVLLFGEISMRKMETEKHNKLIIIMFLDATTIMVCVYKLLLHIL